MTAIEEIAAERKRQVDKEGWSSEHDDIHDDGSLARAAAAYAFFSTLEHRDRISSMHNKDSHISILRFIWPFSWSWEWWKPKNRRRDLVRAGALIVAEIERLDRASKTASAT